MGAEARVAIAEDLVLDFSGLFTGEPPEKQAPESPVEPFLGAGEYKTLTEPQKPVDGLTEGLEGQQAKKLYLDAQREREDHQRSLEVYRTYQENIKTSSQLQTEILKGLKAGEDVYSLFLKAAKAISLMTSNSLFYSQIEEDIEAIYGRGLQHKPPLQKELQETQTRLQRLLEAGQREQPPDSRERIQRAIEAHRATIERLEDMIAKADTKKSGEL
jgi:uncharacterized membrane protein YccC